MTWDCWPMRPLRANKGVIEDLGEAITQADSVMVVVAAPEEDEADDEAPGANRAW